MVGSYKFSWEEKLVAPLIAAPNVDRAIEDKMIGKKATLQATHVIHTCRKESLFFFAKIGQSPSMNYASSFEWF